MGEKTCAIKQRIVWSQMCLRFTLANFKMLAYLGSSCWSRAWQRRQVGLCVLWGYSGDSSALLACPCRKFGSSLSLLKLSPFGFSHLRLGLDDIFLHLAVQCQLLRVAAACRTTCDCCHGQDTFQEFKYISEPERLHGFSGTVFYCAESLNANPKPQTAH